jgi:hypothetical protein
MKVWAKRVFERHRARDRKLTNNAKDFMLFLLGKS